ncbi:MAG: PDZ domain-containing protein [Phycisphaerae bacterium]|nr:PDZ domain-containing protein [Phycisphaerae bacterium]
MPRRNIIWIAILLAMTAVLLLVWRQPGGARLGGPGEFGPVEQTYRVIRENFYQPIDAKDLQRAAVRGMVGELDEFSTYVPPEKARSLTDRVLGEGRDLGLEWTLEKTGLVVLGPRPNSPAHKAGLFSGDRIVAIDGLAVGTLKPANIRSLLSPPPGKHVELTVLDAQSNETRVVRLKTEPYSVETVQGLFRDARGGWQYRMDEKNGVCYLRIPEFCPETPRRLVNLLREMETPRGLVLDLRDNPGGVLSDGVAVADVFLREGIIVRIVERDGKPQVYRAHSDTPHAEMPMVVLIDERTTSAAELVAGALAANSRAVLLGQRTRGKGRVQTMIRLPDKLGQINLTTAEFLVPPDQAIQRHDGAKQWGVQPQVTVALRDEQSEAIRRRRRSTCLLPRPVKSAATDEPDKNPTLLAVSKARANDPQLARAEALLQKPKQMQAILRELAERNRLAREAFLKKQAEEARRAERQDEETQ